MENKLKKLLHYVLIPQKDFFSKTGPKPLKRKRERGKNVRICSPSLALKTTTTTRSSRKILLLVLSGANMCPSSLWPLPLTPDPCHSCAELRPAELSIICRRRGGCRWVTHTWLVVTSRRPHLPVPTEADRTPTLLHFWYSSSRVVSIPKCGMALRDAAHPLTTKGIESNQSKLLNCNQTVTKPMPQP